MTLPFLLERHIHHFCWVVPEEGLPGLASLHLRREELWPHGAFLYVSTRYSSRCCTESSSVEIY